MYSQRQSQIRSINYIIDIEKLIEEVKTDQKPWQVFGDDNLEERMEMEGVSMQMD